MSDERAGGSVSVPYTGPVVKEEVSVVAEPEVVPAQEEQAPIASTKKSAK